MKKRLSEIMTTIVVLASIGVSIPASAKQDDLDAGQFKLDMLLARRGDRDAQYYVGNAFEEGRVTHKDLNQAFDWYSKAAQQDQHDAQYKLGYFYENGLGINRDTNKAMMWYKRAAENSCSQVRDRLNQQAFAHRKEEMKRSLEIMKAEQEKRDHERKLAEERARQDAMRKQQQQALSMQKKTAAVTTARPVKAVRVSIPDITDVVMNNKWRNNSESADYLPSSTTHCLRASGSEIVCFSDEKQRTINGMQITYTTKATLTGFRPDGTFQIKYNYNAIRIDKVPNHGVSVDPNGLKLEQGWQKPRLDINCRTSDRINLYCARGSIRLDYHN